MYWYLAKMVFRILTGNGEHAPQFDEQLRLIRAADKAEAFHQAREIGKGAEESFFNRKNELVQWQFINVCEINQLDEIRHGTELYSRITDAEDGNHYEYVINKKAENIPLTNQVHPVQLV
jgi:hypothetical protein